MGAVLGREPRQRGGMGLVVKDGACSTGSQKAPIGVLLRPFARLSLQSRGDRQEQPARIAGNRRETIRSIKGRGTFVLRVDDQRESADAEAIRAHDGVGDQCAP